MAERRKPKRQTGGLRGTANLDGPPFFKEHPQEAVKRLASHKEDPSEYVRKSVGNALRDIREKYPDLVRDELRTWRLETKEIKQTYRLANAFLTERKRGEETR